MVSLFYGPNGTNRTVTFATLIAAFAIASVFFRFGSFALECVAFLATWSALDQIGQFAIPARLRAGHGSTPEATGHDRR